MTGAEQLTAGPDDGLDGATIEVTVGPVAHGGHCVARLPASAAPRDDGSTPAGRVVFVRHALPGERVRAVVTEEHASYLRADAIEILDASPRRVTPPCPWAGPGHAHGAPRAELSRPGVLRACGGCDLQHADLAYQRELKSAVLREQLVRIGGLDESTVDSLRPVVQPLPPVPGEPDGQGWRTRVQYTVDSTGRAGLLAHRSHEVIAVERCLIAHAAIRDTDVLRRTWPEHDSIEVIAGADGAATVLARRGGGPVSLVSGPATVTERAAGRRWSLPPTAFWQVHPSAADTLAAAVVDLLAPRPGEGIWDLYGGVGLFAAALADAGARSVTLPEAGVQAADLVETDDRSVGEGRSAGRSGGPGSTRPGSIRPGPTRPGSIVTVDADPAAVAAARENLRDLPTVTVVHSDVARALRGPARSAARRGESAVPSGRVDLVVLDPPRSGAGRAVVAAVAERGPRAVAYVACDPAALARDVRTLRAYGYKLAALRAYDLFPHTHHMEVVALLTPA
ncbi:MAG: class I SAM-dependent RNA methyltransferase [Micromonosporaceae bacterium]|nr:class I SAM-dependent RNA methyltransferase [Micromonosporaceae bacterium]